MSAAAAYFGLDDAQKDTYLGGYLMAAFFLVGAPAALLVRLGNRGGRASRRQGEGGRERVRQGGREVTHTRACAQRAVSVPTCSCMCFDEPLSASPVSMVVVLCMCFTLCTVLCVKLMCAVWLLFRPAEPRVPARLHCCGWRGALPVHLLGE